MLAYTTGNAFNIHMEGRSMDIYVNQMKKAVIAEQNLIHIKDVAEIIADGDIGPAIRNMVLLSVNTQQSKTHYLIRNTDIIRTIKKTFPDHTVNCIGETDTVVERTKAPKRDNPAFRYFKVLLVVMILFVGSATAIMSFHTDAEIPKIFEKFHEIIFGQKNETPLIIVIPYAIGILSGIIVFFNHITGKKVTDDPTPIEVEISKYERDITDTVFDVLESRRLGDM